MQENIENSQKIKSMMKPLKVVIAVIIMANMTKIFMKKNSTVIPIQKEVLKVRLKNGCTENQNGRKKARDYQSKTLMIKFELFLC